MSPHSPHYVSEDESDARGIKDGWYAMAKNGSLVSGPFRSHQDCQQHISHAALGPTDASRRRASDATRAVTSSWHAREPHAVRAATLTRAGPYWVVE